MVYSTKLSAPEAAPGSQLTITAGGLEITAGGATVSAGGLYVTTGGATIGSGGLFVDDGGINALVSAADEHSIVVATSSDVYTGTNLHLQTRSVASTRPVAPSPAGQGLALSSSPTCQSVIAHANVSVPTVFPSAHHRRWP